MQPLYSGSEISTKKVENIIEDYLQDIWDYDDVTVDKIGFGKWGSQMMKGKANKIVLKVYPVSDKIINSIDIGNQLWQYEQVFTVDMWMRSVRVNVRDIENTLYGMAVYIEDLFAQDPRRMRSLGITEVTPRVAQSVPNEDSEDMVHEVLDLYVKYLKKRS